MIPIAFINLDRRPDRRQSVEQQLSEYTGSVYRFVAKDARVYRFTQDELGVFAKADFMREPHIAKAIMCNFLSHYDLWDFMTERRLSKMVILQDDVVLKPNFVSYVHAMAQYLPEDAEVVWLGLPEQVSFRNFGRMSGKEWMTEEVTPYVSRLLPTVNPCSLAYLITLEGARRLKEHAQAKGVHRATDGWMNDYLIEKKMYYVSSELVATNQPAFGSDIF
jgi:GR25 family glycosyltransferase involved in LPS biosynthesis